MSEEERQILELIAAKTKCGQLMGVDLWPIFTDACRCMGITLSLDETHFTTEYLKIYRSVSDDKVVELLSIGFNTTLTI